MIAAVAGACGSDSGTPTQVIAAARETSEASTFKTVTTSTTGDRQEVTSSQIDLDREVMAVWPGDAFESDPLQVWADDRLYWDASYWEQLWNVDISTAWVVMDLDAQGFVEGATDDASEAFASAFSIIASAPGSPSDPTGLDPRTYLEQLREESQSVEARRREAVRGMDSVLYRVTFDRERVQEEVERQLGEIMDDANPEMQEALEAFRGLASQVALPVDVWVGEDGFIRRVRQEFPNLFGGFSDEGDTFFGNAAPQPETMIIETEFFDFGVPVEVDVPADDDVTPIEDLDTDEPTDFETFDAESFSPEPVSDWTPVRRGAFDGYRWELLTIEAAEDSVCMTFESDPPLRQRTLPADLLVKGKEATCLLPPRPEPGSDALRVYVTELEDWQAFNIVAGFVRDGVERVGVRFEDGGEKVVPTVDSTFVVLFETDRQVASLHPDLGPGKYANCEREEYDYFPCRGRY